MSEQLANLPISYEELRSLVIDWCGQISGGQLNDLRTAIAKIALDRGHATDPAAQRQSGYGMRTVSFSGYGQAVLSDRDYGRAQSIVWDLIIEGVLRPGLGDGANDSLPFFHVTDFGKHRLKEGPQSPYDPDGYLKRLRSKVAGLDPIVVTYLNESLHTFRIG